ncbi:hypothetical protein BVX98_06335 [bacterium F11]|nr:hypothetical protein BVX98_06335 [bacterium F11]
MEQIIEKTITLLKNYSHKGLVAILILIGFWLIGYVAKSLICYTGKRTRLPEAFLEFIAQTTYWIMIISGFIFSLANLGINISALVASLGLTGFALGFALRDALSNLISGILILIYRPFKEGNHISVAGFDGLVVDIDLRYTILNKEGKKILIPNLTLFTNPVLVTEGDK